MGLWRKTKTEHAGDKGSTRSTGYFGPRAWAKWASRKLRRVQDKQAVDEG